MEIKCRWRGGQQTNRKREEVREKQIERIKKSKEIRILTLMGEGEIESKRGKVREMRINNKGERERDSKRRLRVEKEEK